MTQAQALQALELLRDCTAIEYMQIGRYDVLYNPYNVDGSMWEVYEHDSDHIEYQGYEDIYRASEVLIAQ
jgi:hypothetical protein